MSIEMKEGKFDSSVESLRNYQCPDWFKNGKFGIWAHWGPQCVPMIGDWYARNMYIEGHAMYKYHCENYGHPSEFGYKDIIPLWKAENFDPKHLVSLYKKAGAKYIIALAVHHDNYDCWNSKHQKWNSVNIGPKADIVGLWAEAAREAGLNFGVTVHHERSYSWFSTNKGHDTEGPYKDIPYDGNDEKYRDLYYEPYEDTNPAYPTNPSESFVDGWYNRIKDLVENYNPDLLYTDGGVPFGEVGRTAIANFYNHSMETHDGKLEAVYNCKDFRISDSKSGLTHGEFFENICVQDIERGVTDSISPVPWQTDTCIGQWYYKRGVEYKSANYVVKMLCDIVSKNGNLLLNIPLKPDGTIDPEEEVILEGISNWMAVNSECIYDTTPWKLFKEGDTANAGEFKEEELADCNTTYRFTKKDNCIYAICFGWNDKEFVVKSLGKTIAEFDVKKVSMLGVDEALTFVQEEDQLLVTSPQTKPWDGAYCLKVEY